MNKKTKRGFTIVELVIVIAVIAILAAVLIPTFASVIKKANLSADQQAVTTMNKQLAIADVDEDIDSLPDAITALADAGLDLEDYKPLTKDHYFYFTVVDGTPTVLLADKEDNVVFPENAKESDTAKWFSLSGAAPVDKNFKAVNGVATIDTGAQLATAIQNAKDGKDTISNVTLNADVNLRGAGVDFGKVSSDLTIDGNDKTLAGVRADANSVSPTSGEYAGHEYGFGFVGEIPTGKTVTIKDVTLDGLFAGNTVGTHEDGANTTGLIAGYVRGTLILENVKITNSTVYGYQKVGAIVGQVLGGTVILKNVTFKNVTVIGNTEVATIAGIVNTTGTITLENTTTEGITVSSTANGQFKKADLTAKGVTINGNDNNTFILTESDSYAAYGADAIVFGAVTTDWAWVSSATYGSIKLIDRPTISGYDKNVKLNGYTDSTSEF